MMNKHELGELAAEFGKVAGYTKYMTLDDKQKAIIAFGMTPIEVMPEEDYGPVFKKAFVLGLMDAAKAEGKMVV